MKQPRRVSGRQLTLLAPESVIRLDEKARQEVIRALADLLLEALDEVPGGSTEVRNESKD